MVGARLYGILGMYGEVWNDTFCCVPVPDDLTQEMTRMIWTFNGIPLFMVGAVSVVNYAIIYIYVRNTIATSRARDSRNGLLLKDDRGKIFTTYIL